MKPKKIARTAGRDGKRNRSVRKKPPLPTVTDKLLPGGENSAEPMRDAEGIEIRRASIYFGPGSFGDVLGCDFGGGPIISDGSDVMVAYNNFDNARRPEVCDESGRGEPMFEVGPNAKRNAFIGNTSVGGSGMIGRVDGEDSYFEGNTAISEQAVNAILAEIRRASDELEAEGKLPQEARSALSNVLNAGTFSTMYHNAGTAASLLSATPLLYGLLQRLIESLHR